MGEQHYGGGLIECLPLRTPKVAFAAYATMTRQLNRMNYVKAIDTGSTSVFCLQFQHYRTGELLHVFWALRGKCPISLSVPAGAKVVVFDQMDNATELIEQGGLVTFTATQSVRYVNGLKADAKMSLGEPDHSDSKPPRRAGVSPPPERLQPDFTRGINIPRSPSNVKTPRQSWRRLVEDFRRARQRLRNVSHRLRQKVPVER